eukprot:TRINITY_DN49206_c0_g1_i2.p1 TRINITY_DN49206_c0_g1~~TRINITY_DN49206_c0_g1_i2.p1  ORF type:complete len:612 (+),score=141.58 TRINITY_DN49206_c0_g1_i2:265-1836(+)
MKEAEALLQTVPVKDDDLADAVEALCSVKAQHGKWLTTLDLQSDGELLKVVRQDRQGTCRSECLTVQRACSKALRGREEDLVTLLRHGAQFAELQASICGRTCAAPARPLQRERKDEVFEPKDDEKGETSLTWEHIASLLAQQQETSKQQETKPPEENSEEKTLLRDAAVDEGAASAARTQRSSAASSVSAERSVAKAKKPELVTDEELAVEENRPKAQRQGSGLKQQTRQDKQEQPTGESEEANERNEPTIDLRVLLETLLKASAKRQEDAGTLEVPVVQQSVADDAAAAGADTVRAASLAVPPRLTEVPSKESPATHSGSQRTESAAATQQPPVSKESEAGSGDLWGSLGWLDAVSDEVVLLCFTIVLSTVIMSIMSWSVTVTHAVPPRQQVSQHAGSQPARKLCGTCSPAQSPEATKEAADTREEAIADLLSAQLLANVLKGLAEDGLRSHLGQATAPVPARRCRNCGASAPEYACSGCGMAAWYCCAVCQREDWPSHQQVCCHSQAAAVGAGGSAVIST